MSKESKELRAQRYKIIQDAQALLVDGDSPELNAKFDAAMKDADALEARITRIENAETALANQMEDLRNKAGRNGTSTEQEKERAELEASTFNTWVRRGAGALNDEQREVFSARFQNAAGTTPDTAGGYTVPQGFYTRLIDAQLAYGGMLQEAYVFDTTGANALPIPTDNDTSNKGALVGENSPAVPQDITFGAVTMNGYTYSSKIVLVSNQLLQDSAFDLDAFISAKIGTRIARVINDDFTTGSGAKKPTGLLTAGTLGYTAGGSTSSGSTATIAFDDLVELEHSVDPAYRNGAKWMFHDTTLKVLKKLKDGLGRPLWMAGLQTKEPDSINGYEYSINQSFPVLGAGNSVVAFGDLKNYFIRRIAGIQMLRLTERYAEYNQVGFMAFQRWDGQLIDAGTHPVKYLANSAT